MLTEAAQFTTCKLQLFFCCFLVLCCIHYRAGLPAHLTKTILENSLAMQFTFIHNSLKVFKDRRNILKMCYIIMAETKQTNKDCCRSYK